MHLDEADQKIVGDVLSRCVPGNVGVYAYGSRIHGRGLKPFSDLDLCLIGRDVRPADSMIYLRTAFEDSDLRINVDTVDWWLLSDEFRQAIRAELHHVCGPDILLLELCEPSP